MSEQTAQGRIYSRGRRWDDRLTRASLGWLEVNESAAVFGMLACLALLSLGLISNITYGVSIVYAFPIALSTWLFGRWVGVATGAFAICAAITVAIVQHGRSDTLAVVVPALALITVVCIAGSEWARRSEHLVRLLNQRQLRHRQLLETMTKVGQELVASKRWEVIAEHMMSSLVDDLELDAAWMFERDSSAPSPHLNLLAAAGDQPAVEVAEPGVGTVGWVIRTGRIIQAHSREELLALQPGLALGPLEDGLEGMLVLPVLLKGTTTGVVMLGTREQRTWRSEEVGIAAALVNQLGLAMENASAYRATIEALVRMEEISQLKSDLLKTVSHELRTPMTVLAGYMDMMRDGSLGAVPDAWVRPLQLVTVKVDELNRLVQMMLDASRAEGPSLQVHLEDVDVAAAVAMAVSAQEDEAATSQHQLRLEAPRNPVSARADRDKLLVVIRNLIENAVKYSPPDTSVDIGLAADADVVRIWVADRGAGVPDDEKHRIFEQFYRVASSDGHRSVGGAGLGLFIVKQLVEVQGGRITVDDRPGGGSVFTIVVPRRPEVLPGTGQVASLEPDEVYLQHHV
ncbi:MAG TPA: HAMP domain-containing sensor histidine kinase [Candidatus Solibacter sp.]|jgi:signal transduction histidine kinase|nr:HAMP domain-containing sensor histidine kinase [Candidatus Solibacter sp.]